MILKYFYTTIYKTISNNKVKKINKKIFLPLEGVGIISTFVFVRY